MWFKPNCVRCRPKVFGSRLRYACSTLGPYAVAGMPPALRSLRAPPLPWLSRGLALMVSVICGMGTTPSLSLYSDKQRADRLAQVDAAQSLRKQRRGREDLDLLALAGRGGQGNGVGDHELFDDRGLDPLEGRPR